MKKNKGFTLIELLAVIAILGVLLSISVVAVNKIKKNQDEENYKNVLSSILTGAKSYIADHPEKLDFSANTCNHDRTINDGMVACTHTDNSEKIISISVVGLQKKGYIDLDTENSLYKDLINDNNDTLFNSRSVVIKKCGANSLKLKYMLYDMRDGTKEYNDCGCEEQQSSDPNRLSEKLCIN